MPSVAVDGQDVFAMYEATREAVDGARRGEGPAFIKAMTYRYFGYFGHFEGDNLLYRTKEEEEFHQYCRLLQRAGRGSRGDFPYLSVRRATSSPP